MPHEVLPENQEPAKKKKSSLPWIVTIMIIAAIAIFMAVSKGLSPVQIGEAITMLITAEPDTVYQTVKTDIHLDTKERAQWSKKVDSLQEWSSKLSGRIMELNQLLEDNPDTVEVKIYDSLRVKHLEQVAREAVRVIEEVLNFRADTSLPLERTALIELEFEDRTDTIQVAFVDSVQIHVDLSGGFLNLSATARGNLEFFHEYAMTVINNPRLSWIERVLWFTLAVASHFVI